MPSKRETSTSQQKVTSWQQSFELQSNAVWYHWGKEGGLRKFLEKMDFCGKIGNPWMERLVGILRTKHCSRATLNGADPSHWQLRHFHYIQRNVHTAGIGKGRCNNLRLLPKTRMLAQIYDHLPNNNAISDWCSTNGGWMDGSDISGWAGWVKEHLSVRTNEQQYAIKNEN